MIYKITPVALCSGASLPSFLSPLHITSSCSPSSRWPRGREHIGPLNTESNSSPRHALLSRRCYASVSDGPKKPSASSGWHDWPSSPNPTPYEIFGQLSSAPYSKAKFYTLVKLYHPDRHQYASVHVLSHAVRLERYRLIVAANEILSDPAKRRAYDAYGAGWGGIRSMDNLYRKAYRSWRDVPGNPSMNATWEDWERWYEERDGRKKKQSPLFMSNELFVSVLCAFVVVGSMGQARRASTNTMNIVEMREQKHSAISDDMRRRRDDQAGLDRHGRVESFLRSRESWNIASSLNTRGAQDSDSK
ncbi:hypothetical protein F5B20DRAFT_83797 [Whalleya microplaca]|nr:hypothetical protein F5B20DRAFT_83797 [Whalleya microplaca]